ncbi:hypothetical protein D3C71_1648550 [compost metagenome]
MELGSPSAYRARSALENDRRHETLSPSHVAEISEPNARITRMRLDPPDGLNESAPQLGKRTAPVQRRGSRTEWHDPRFSKVSPECREPALQRGQADLAEH